MQITIKAAHVDNAIEVAEHFKTVLIANLSGHESAPLAVNTLKDILNKLNFDKLFNDVARDGGLTDKIQDVVFVFDETSEAGQCELSLLKRINDRASIEANMTHFRAEVAKNEN